MDRTDTTLDLSKIGRDAKSMRRENVGNAGGGETLHSFFLEGGGGCLGRTIAANGANMAGLGGIRG